ncbi:transcriptional regulator NrdR [Fusibacter tunisiensis]|uniref:Transcriptional repressor NrdR n=1 Tax=Fusibacter tunisiensis TaxID=1008308 RepID=A0ABS2MM81_9FIRM|nr:transcriptional regulator NrdR [Fusibacter tunisiensis]MBM7560506.1 transcriptional repressor NrdR [Fusibacter tunisiensis]
MKCPFCNNLESKVVDSRPTDDGHVIRRRRECIGCGERFTTYEKIEEIPMIIVKKNGMRESYNRMKVLNGIIRACEKRPVTMEQMEALIDRIEMTLHSSMEKEIQSEWVGELVMSGLKDLDEVAYVRFASVYRQFKDINTFITELTKLLNEKTPLK